MVAKEYISYARTMYTHTTLYATSAYNPYLFEIPGRVQTTMGCNWHPSQLQIHLLDVGWAHFQGYDLGAFPGDGYYVPLAGT